MRQQNQLILNFCCGGCQAHEVVESNFINGIHPFLSTMASTLRTSKWHVGPLGLDTGQHPQSIFATLAVQGTQIILLELKYPILPKVELQLSRSEVASPERTPPFAPDFPKKNMGHLFNWSTNSIHEMPCVLLTSQLLHWLSFTLWVNHSLFSMHSMSKLLSSILVQVLIHHSRETSVNSTYPSTWDLVSSKLDSRL